MKINKLMANFRGAKLLARWEPDNRPALPVPYKRCKKWRLSRLCTGEFGHTGDHTFRKNYWWR